MSLGRFAAIPVIRSLLQKPEDQHQSGPLFWRISFAGLILLFLFSWLFIFFVEGASPGELFSRENAARTSSFLLQFVGAGDPEPAYLNWDNWRQALSLTYETLLMSVLAIGLATFLMLVSVLPAARVTSRSGTEALRSRTAKILHYFIRLSYLFSRAIPELIWAMLIIFFFTPGILPGALALGLHNFGILGKLCAEVVEDLDPRPARSLRASGAGHAQVLFYAVLPMVLPKFLTYILYRWEVILRTTIVVGFVSAGGLGRQFRLSMSWFHYTDVALLLFCYVILVLSVDLLSAGLRRLAR